MQRLTDTYIHHFHGHDLNLVHCFQRLLLYSTSASSSSSTTTDSFANYLVDSLGFSHQQALSTSTKLSINKKVNDSKFDANPNSVVAFFRHYGFNDTHLRKMVSFGPRLLFSNVDSTLKPKLQLFLDKGFSGSDLVRVISVNPKLLQLSVESSISAIEVVRQVMGCDALVIAVFKKMTWNVGGIMKNMLHNVDLLTSYGIPTKSIRKHIVKHPGTFLRNPEKFKEMVIRLENKLGIPRDAPMFLTGVHLLCGHSEENIESKFQIFRSFGWTQSDIDTIMMKQANCFQLSDESIKKKLDFLINKLQLKPAYMIPNSVFLTYSLEKRLVPRHKVLVILKEQGLLEKYPRLGSFFRMSEPCFSKRFVIPFKEVHQVYAKHTGCSKMQSLTERYNHTGCSMEITQAKADSLS